MVDPSSLSVTRVDVTAKQASEYTDLSSTSDNVIADENVSDILDYFPDVLLTKESSTETEHENNWILSFFVQRWNQLCLMRHWHKAFLRVKEK